MKHRTLAPPAGPYRVAVLNGAEIVIDPTIYQTLEGGARGVGYYKRRGRTAWLETVGGVFVPVKGATRKPV